MSGGEVATVWRCYHCGDVFTDDRCAGLHFGRDEDSLPACQIKAGAEQGLLGALRDAEYAASDARQAIADECTEAARAHYAQMMRHNAALRNAEEAGYERGLADGCALAPTPPAAASEGVRELLERIAGNAQRMADAKQDDSGLWALCAADARDALSRLASLSPAQPEVEQNEMRCAQIAMGHGKVDVGVIEWEGRKGLLLRPRESIISLGDDGEIAGDYWPDPADVVIWIDDPKGADVIVNEIAPLATPIARKVQIQFTADEVAYIDGLMGKATPTATHNAEALREAAQFLSDRLDDLEWMDDDLAATARDYFGHVDPAHARLRSALDSAEVKS